MDNNYYSFVASSHNKSKPGETNHIFVIDSRDRNKKFHPNPASYTITFNQDFKNISKIELKGSCIPKTEYNVNTENYIIPFNVEDYVTEFRIVSGGFGYQDGVYNNISLTSPAISGGINAQISVVVIDNSISNITITEPGTGYLRGSYGGSANDPTNGFYTNGGVSFIDSLIPKDNSLQFTQAIINFSVGHEIVARLRPGQYDFANPNDNDVGLCAEVTLALQEATQDAIDKGILVPSVGGPTTGVQYFPSGGTDTGSCFLYTPVINASENSNVAIQRGDPTNTGGGYTQSLFLELLWGTSPYVDSAATQLLGFGSSIDTITKKLTPMDQTSGSIDTVWVSTPIEGRNDYDLVDFPRFTILSFAPFGKEVDRLDGLNPAIDKGFATLIFDANPPEVIFRAPSSTAAPGTGTSDYTSLLLKPGVLKAIKGADFDQKVLKFKTPVAQMSMLTINFKKYNGDLYDFHGRDHILIFQLTCKDLNAKNQL